MIGGENAFLEVVDAFDAQAIQAGIEAKLVREIVPEPATVSLVGLLAVLPLISAPKRMTASNWLAFAPN